MTACSIVLVVLLVSLHCLGRSFPAQTVVSLHQWQSGIVEIHHCVVNSGEWTPNSLGLLVDYPFAKSAT